MRDLSVEDADHMKRFEGAFVRWLKPWQANTNPELMAIVLVRCARTVLRLCPPNDQKQLLPVLMAFLEGKVNPPTQQASDLLWTPDQGAPRRPM